MVSSEIPETRFGGDEADVPGGPCSGGPGHCQGAGPSLSLPVPVPALSPG